MTESMVKCCSTCRVQLDDAGGAPNGGRWLSCPTCGALYADGSTMPEPKSARGRRRKRRRELPPRELPPEYPRSSADRADD